MGRIRWLDASIGRRLPASMGRTRWLAVSIGSAAFVLVLVGAWLAWRWSGHTSRAGLAAWLEAVATFAAFAAAVLAATFAAGAFRLESQREARWVDQQRLAQASLVAAWLGTHRVEEDMPDNQSRPQKGVYLRNASDVPVTQVQYQICLEEIPFGIRVIGSLPPAADPVFIKHEAGDFQSSMPGFEVYNVEIDEYEVGLSFRDAGGRSWYRTPDGRLVEGDPPWDTEQAAQDERQRRRLRRLG